MFSLCLIFWNVRTSYLVLSNLLPSSSSCAPYYSPCCYCCTNCVRCGFLAPSPQGGRMDTTLYDPEIIEKNVLRSDVCKTKCCTTIARKEKC
jgi:hypothetical protein